MDNSKIKAHLKSDKHAICVVHHNVQWQAVTIYGSSDLGAVKQKQTLSQTDDKATLVITLARTRDAMSNLWCPVASPFIDVMSP
jgi:hypothetical protein